MKNNPFKNLIMEFYGDGYVRYKCPKCKSTIFYGYCMGITMYDLEKCDCGYKLDIKFDEVENE